MTNHPPSPRRTVNWFTMVFVPRSADRQTIKTIRTVDVDGVCPKECRPADNQEWRHCWCTMVFVPRNADRQTIKTGGTVDVRWCLSQGVLTGRQSRLEALLMYDGVSPKECWPADNQDWTHCWCRWCLSHGVQRQSRLEALLISA